MSYDDNVHGSSAAASSSFETVEIPDVFMSFSAQPHKVNPLYEQATTESVMWLARWAIRITPRELADCPFSVSLGTEELEDNSVYEYLRNVDVARWAASAVPEAGYEALRTLIDWFNVVFLYDDRTYLSRGIVLLIHLAKSLSGVWRRKLGSWSVSGGRVDGKSPGHRQRPVVAKEEEASLGEGSWYCLVSHQSNVNQDCL
jgi:hypothetical protein